MTLSVIVFVSVFLCGMHFSLALNDNSTFDEVYKEATQYYLDNNWEECIAHFELALEKYRLYRRNVINCRHTCRQESESAKPIIPENIEDLPFYEKLLKNTLCLLMCQQKFLNTRFDTPPKDVENEFEEYKPYEYLQLCYYQKNELQKAASATFTYLVRHPNHEIMINNLKFYTTLPEVDIVKVTNFEAAKYINLFVQGNEAYNLEDFDSVIHHMEESLEEYLKSDEECRLFCEGPFDQGWFPDFVSSLSNHFTFCLKCKRKCSESLNTINGEYHEDFLANYFHYLQYAYFQKGNLEKACEAVATYLMFFAGDDVMLKNKEYYLTLPKVKEEFFKPRAEIKKYFKRDAYEDKLFSYIENAFSFDKEKKDESNALDESS